MIRRAKRIGWIPAGLLLAIGLLLGSSSPATAGPRERLEEELRQTDQGLERAAEIVRESDSQRARELLEHAVVLQRRAWDQFRAGHLRIAGGLTLEARQIGLRAVTLAREDSGLQQRALRELEAAARALEHARDEIADGPGGAVLRLLEEARAQIERGKLQFRERHYEAAFRLALSAQRLIRQALGAGPGTGGGERVLRELQRTDRLIERVRPVVRDSGDEEAMRILDRAVDLQARAWEAFRAGRPRAAFGTTREARGLANRAFHLVRGPVDLGNVARALQETERILGRAAEIVRESGNDRALRLLEKARDHQRKAERLLEDEQPRAALAETRVARSLAKRAIRLAQEGEA